MFADDITVEYAVASKPGIFDTGSTCLSIPSNEYILITKKLVSMLSGYTVDAFGSYVFNCSHKTKGLYPFFIRLGVYWA